MSTQHTVDVHPVDDSEAAAMGSEKTSYWIDCVCGWWAVVAGRANADQRASAHTAAHEPEDAA